MADNPFAIDLYDKTFHRVGWVNDPISIECIPRHNQVGTATLVVPGNHRRLGQLLDEGARVTIDYGGERALSGVVNNPSGSYGPDGQFTLPIVGDQWLLQRMLGWALPSAAIDAQGAKEDKRTGPAETVLKGFVAANAAHMVDPITVAADLARGTTITVSSRMKQLSEILLTAIDQAGIGVSVTQVGTRLVVDAYVPKVYSRNLSLPARTVLTADWSRTDPTINVAITGGNLTGTSREFGRVRAGDLEARFGYTIESFVDAGSTESSTARDAEGTKALADGGPKSGLKLTLSESKSFRYGGENGVHVGDRVTVDLGDGATTTDLLREVTLSYSRDNGLAVTPSVGDHEDDPDAALYARLQALNARLATQETR